MTAQELLGPEALRELVGAFGTLSGILDLLDHCEHGIKTGDIGPALRQAMRGPNHEERALAAQVAQVTVAELRPLMARMLRLQLKKLEDGNGEATH